MINQIKFGSLIYERRKAQGFTQEQLGKALGISSQAISKWENGESLPDIGIMADICNVLGVSSDTLLGIDRGIGVDSTGRELAKRIRGLNGEDTKRALTSVLGLLHMCTHSNVHWNNECNIAYNFNNSVPIEVDFWNKQGLVCFIMQEALESENSLNSSLELIRVMVAPENWEVINLLINGPKKIETMLKQDVRQTTESLLSILEVLIDAGIVEQSKGGYKLCAYYPLFIAMMIKALAVEGQNKLGRGILNNTRL